MSDDERDDEPSLELPNLRKALFGRRKPKPAEPVADTSTEHVEPVPEPTSVPAPEPVEPSPQPAPSPEPMPSPLPEPAPVPDPEPIPDPTPAPDPEPIPDPTPVPDPEPIPDPTPVPVPEPDPIPTPDPVAPPTPITPQAEATDHTTVLVADPAVDATMTDGEPQHAEQPRRQFTMPRITLPGHVAALVIGAVVGLVLVGLTFGALHLCTWLRGTSSCGTPGLLLLVVITLLAGTLGSVLLRAAGISSSASTSALGVGLLVVLILLALLGVIFDWWMVVVIPLIGALTYALSWWVTTTYDEPGERVR